MGGSGPFGESSGGPAPIAVENFHCSATGRPPTLRRPADGTGRVNLLNWDGKGRRADCCRPAAEPERSADECRLSRDRTRRRLQAAALCLAYPDEALLAQLPLLRATVAALPAAAAAPLVASSTMLASTPPDRLAARLCADFRPAGRCCLYLTYYAYGDTRKRGMALLRFNHAYRAAGLDAGRRASCPTTLRSSASSPPVSRRPAWCCCASTGPGVELLRRPCTTRARRTWTCSTRSAPCCPTGAARPRPSDAGWPAPAHRRSRSASSRSPRRYHP